MTDVEIRVKALEAASRVFAGKGSSYGSAVRSLAREFEDYLSGR